MAMALPFLIMCYIKIVDVGCHVVMDTSLEEVDLVTMDLPIVMAGVTVVERLCLEVGEDHQVKVANLHRKEMEIAIIVEDMDTLKESVTKNRMTPREVEAVAGHSILTFINVVVSMAVKDRTKVVIYLPCNEY